MKYLAKIPMKLPPQEALTEEEAEAILRQTHDPKKGSLRDYCILSLMLHTGLRRAEIASLKVGSLSGQGNKLWLIVFGKGQKYRKIPLKNELLIERLGKYLEKVGNKGKLEAPMFLTRSQRGGRPIQAITPETIRRVVEKNSKLANIQKRVSSHTLRHTFLTRALEKTGDLAGVRDLAGHSSIQTTNRYLHSSEERMEKIIEKLGL